MNRPFSPRTPPSPSSFTRVNGKIRAREVRVIGVDGKQLGVLTLAEAINMARANAVDLVEIVPNATPPVCRLVDFGKYRYEQAKKEKESKKHQHANKIKEVQLSPNIDPHDFGVKMAHVINFLCEDMKVKVTLRFRGRELAHKEIGFQVVDRFIKETAPWAHPDTPPKLIGKGINVMLSPLPRNKRAKNPHENQVLSTHLNQPDVEDEDDGDESEEQKSETPKAKGRVPTSAAESSGSGFANNPFDRLTPPGGPSEPAA